MNLKVIYGGFNRDFSILIEDLIGDSPKTLVGINLGQKVTKVALKRKLADATVSLVLLNESDYKNVKESLSDDRLVCVIGKDTIRNIFKLRYGVSNDSDVEVEGEEDLEEESDLGLDLDTYESEFTETASDSVESDSTSEKELSWDEILEGYNSLTFDDGVENELEEEEDIDEPLIHSNQEIEDEVEYVAIEELDEEPAKSTLGDTKLELKGVINNLSKQLEEYKNLVDSSVSLEDYRELQSEYDTKKNENNSLLEKLKEKEDLESQIEELLDKNEKLKSDLSAKITEGAQIEEVKIKFKDLVTKHNNLRTAYEELRSKKSSRETTIPKLKGNYPNVEFIVPLSGACVIETYDYISSIKDEFLFIDLTNDTYVDSYIKVKGVVRPSKWFIDGANYKDVIANTSTLTHIKLITNVVHKLETGTLSKINWDKLLGDLALEPRVIINIGSVFNDDVLKVLKAVQYGVSIKGLVGKVKLSQRVGQYSLQSLDRYKVVASEDVVEAKEFRGLITERY